MLVAIAGCGSGGSQGQNKNQTKPTETEKQAGETTSKMPDIITYATQPVGGNFNSISVAQSNLLSKKLGIIVTAEPTAGGKVNAEMLSSKQADLAILTSLDGYQMYRGEDQYKDMGPTPITLLMSGNESYYGIQTMKNSGIKTTADLKGKRIFDDRQGMTWVKPLVKAQLAALGLDPEKDVTHIKYQHSNEVIDQIIQGKGDASWGSLSKSSLSSLDEAKGAYVVPLSEKEGDAIHKLYPSMHRALLPKDLPGAPKGTPVVGNYTIMVSRQDLPEDVVYNLVKTLMENQKELTGVNAVLSEWNPQRAVMDPVAPFHPGAIKYYKEVGVWTPELDKLQEELKNKK